MDIEISTEKELKNWFVQNYNKLGYDKIVRHDTGIFPDFIMLRGGKELSVELETLSSHFLLHKHDAEKVHEIVCVRNDLVKNTRSVPIIEIKNLTYKERIRRVSATIDKNTLGMLTELIKKERYRNKAHAIEDAIINLYKSKIGAKDE